MIQAWAPQTLGASVAGVRGDDRDERAPWQNSWSFRGQGSRLFRSAAILGGAVAAVVMIMAILTDPIAPLGSPAAYGTSDWSVIPDRRPCGANDDDGFTYAGQLTNHSEVARDFTVNVAFEVDGRREALGSMQVAGLQSGQRTPVEITAVASFPAGLPDVRCGVQVRHVPTSH